MDRNIESTAKNSIFRAPAQIRYARQSDFEPKLVSIGPYYLGRKNLEEMDEFKFLCMQDLMKNKAFGASDIITVPIELFMMWEMRARSFYTNIDHFVSELFVKMLILDSCFIIRIILSLHQVVQKRMGFLEVNIKEVRSDLLLLENQIPLFFIQEVYEWLFCHTDNPTFPPFNIVLEPFIFLDMPWRFNDGGMSSGADHLLDLYWRCSLSPDILEKVKISRGDRFDKEQPSLLDIHICNGPKPIKNATVIHQMAGIEFKKLNCQPHYDALDVGNKRVRMRDRLSLVRCLIWFNPAKILYRFEVMSKKPDPDLDPESNQTRSNANQKPSSPFDVIFHNGIMQMPCLKIDSSQITLLLNLIAYEHSMLPNMRTVSSYLKLMDALIDTEKDVELLQRSDVIYNTLRSHNKAANFFNDIGNFCLIDSNDHIYHNLFTEVKKYYESSWNHSWASLRHNYFSSPWAGISVGAGVTLLIFSALQTFYTIIGYYKQKHD